MPANKDVTFSEAANLQQGLATHLALGTNCQLSGKPQTSEQRLTWDKTNHIFRHQASEKLKQC